MEEHLRSAALPAPWYLSWTARRTMSKQSAQARRSSPRWLFRPSWGHALLAGLALSSCTLLVPLDDLGGGPDPLADASTDTRDAPPAGPAEPVVVTRSADDTSITVRVEGKFQIDFVEDASWQPARWFDLQQPVIEDLVAGRPFLTSPCEILKMGVGWFGALEATDAWVDVIEETPGRAVVRATYEHDEDWGELQIQTDYTIYASGRVAARAIITNIDLSDVLLNAIEMAHVNVSADLSWAATALAGDRAFAFTRADGPPPASNLLVLNTSPISPLNSDNLTNRYWSIGEIYLLERESLTFTWELQVAPNGQDTLQLADRAGDVLDPGIAVVSGVTLVGTGYDPAQGAYTLTAPSETSVFELTAAEPRHYPVFVLSDWTSPTFSVMRGGVVLASSDAPIGSAAIGTLDPDAQTLVVVNLEELPTSASAADRTYTITP